MASGGCLPLFRNRVHTPTFHTYFFLKPSPDHGDTIRKIPFRLMCAAYGEPEPSYIGMANSSGQCRTAALAMDMGSTLWKFWKSIHRDIGNKKSIFFSHPAVRIYWESIPITVAAA